MEVHFARQLAKKQASQNQGIASTTGFGHMRELIRFERMFRAGTSEKKNSGRTSRPGVALSGRRPV
jgi:hypothetical protein